MRKLIVEEWISVDGHVADKQNRLDFFTNLIRTSYTNADRLKFLETIDCILFGRKTYEQFVALWPDRGPENTLATMMNKTQKIVFSDSLLTAPWGQWAAAHVANRVPAHAIEQLKSLPGKNLVVWGSISLAQSLLKENLVDELHLHLCPSLTGGGRKFFKDDITPVNFNLLAAKQEDQAGTVLLVYKPVSR